jgi:hypothetical protein
MAGTTTPPHPTAKSWLDRVTLRPSVAPMVRRAAAAALLLVVAAPAGAQDLRTERLAEQRAEKASKLHPNEPTTLERRLEMVDRFTSTERPVYAFIGSVFEGGGFALGPGYRTRFGDTGIFNAHAAMSIRRYKEVEASVKLPEMANGRLSVEMHGNWTDAPAVAFFGVGSDSQKADRSTFAYRTTTVGAGARFQPAKHVAFGGGLEAIDVQASDTANHTTASLNPMYRRSRLFAELDTRTSPTYTREGTLFRVDWSDYHQMDTGSNSFQRLDAEVQQFIPLLRENWVIALRARASTTDAAEGHEVPYFMLPSLGGNRFLRGYSTFRFRDNNSLLFTGEYRWTAGPLVDMAVFMDAGKVASRRADLDLQNLQTSYGIGMTLHSFSTTMTRIELARTREGMGLLFSFSPSF